MTKSQYDRTSMLQELQNTQIRKGCKKQKKTFQPLKNAFTRCFHVKQSVHPWIIIVNRPKIKVERLCFSLSLETSLQNYQSIQTN